MSSPRLVLKRLYSGKNLKIKIDYHLLSVQAVQKKVKYEGMSLFCFKDPLERAYSSVHFVCLQILPVSG